MQRDYAGFVRSAAEGNVFCGFGLADKKGGLCTRELGPLVQFD
jgi:hypothetical protein